MEQELPQAAIESRNVLIVDDEPSILTYVATVVAQGGYNVLRATSGEDALRQSREFPGTIHLLLSNVQMTGITGIELSTMISAERPETRVMLMSGFTSGMLMLNEGWHFLHKPFLPAQLLQLITTVVNAPGADAFPKLHEHEHKL